ncbi:MAG: metallophosphoesterase [Sphingobacterium sp.]|jgi:3',5'-cyclic AMP phosphodiesterase CpdA|nr:metallophosphoesterase [Sphingobacterium sp.]
MKRSIIAILSFLFLACFCYGTVNAQEFKFAFLTDMHVHSDSTLGQVDQRLKSLSPQVELLLSGGDNVDIDNLKTAELSRGEQRLKQLKNLFDRTKKPYHMAIGNHDRLPGNLRNGKNDFELFEKTFGQTYCTFEHKGWKFIVLNSVETKDNHYIIGEQQLLWLQDVVKNTAKDQPLVIISHVPFLSVYYPVLEGRYTAADTFMNQKLIFDLFKEHSLKLVLQGHMHLYEEIKVKGVQFITAGAVSGNWWHGNFEGTDPGHLEVDVKGKDFSWTYVK